MNIVLLQLLKLILAKAPMNHICVKLLSLWQK